MTSWHSIHTVIFCTTNVGFYPTSFCTGLYDITANHWPPYWHMSKTPGVCLNFWPRPYLGSGWDKQRRLTSNRQVLYHVLDVPCLCCVDSIHWSMLFEQVRTYERSLHARRRPVFGSLWLIVTWPAFLISRMFLHSAQSCSPIIGLCVLLMAHSWSAVDLFVLWSCWCYDLYFLIGGVAL